MTQPTTPFHLHAAQSVADAPVAPDGDLPAEVAGQPATYFWKEMIHLGDYVHPIRQFTLSVDQSRLQKWQDTGSRMLADGVAIPINCDHSDRARDVVGYVKAFKLDGDRLLALCQFIGEDAAILAARNLVSVGIDPDFTDGQAKNWGEAIVHLALTPVPVVPNQGQFFAASLFDDTLVPLEPTTPAASADPTSLLPSPGTPGEGEGGGAFPPTSASAEEGNGEGEISPSSGTPGEGRGEGSPTNLNPSTNANPAQPATNTPPAHQSKGKKTARKSSATDSLTAELAQAREKIAQLTSRLPPDLSDESATAMIEAATVRFDAAVSRGGLSPAARDRLIATLVRTTDGQPNILALSRHSNPHGNRALALAVADILLDNPPLNPGESTGLQAIARTTPGEDTSPLAQLQQYMTRVASK